jgi:alcohol dehydrogenase (cytochrome c)
MMHLRRFRIVGACLVASLGCITVRAQTAVELGRATFESRCSVCHGADGYGGELGPSLSGRIENLDDVQIQHTILDGVPGTAMPANAVSAGDLSPLISFLRSIRPRAAGFEPYQAVLRLSTGGSLEGTVLGEGIDDLQLRDGKGSIHLLRRTNGTAFREVTSQTDWTTYNGDAGGNRLSGLTQIDRRNVARVGVRWMFQVPNSSGLEVTPIVAGGVMYVTRANECFALDAGSGRQIWHFQRARTRGLIGNAAGGINRGVAVAGDKLFMVTDDAHLLALDRRDGSIVWDTEMADWHQNYNATSAPLIVGGLVITGTAGGEEGVRGFIAAFDLATGREAWRFWTVPGRGEPGAETWHGQGILHGGAPGWFTGVYDAGTDTVFWPTGNPGSDYNGDDRGGDDLYSDCILALDARTGRLIWYYQTTPHDVWDWDASETPLVIDATWRGQARKLLVQANRNGFFYVLDRLTGKPLLGRQFVDELTWARGIAADGRPDLVDGQVPGETATRVCPSQAGATNWYSPSFSPATRLFYVQTSERCSDYKKRRDTFAAGRPFLGGAVKNAASPKPEKILRAIDLETGTVRWQRREKGPSTTAGGTLTTASKLVFFGDDSGAFSAADAASGALLWSFDAAAAWKASPMAYRFDGQEMIGIAAGGNILVFALPARRPRD